MKRKIIAALLVGLLLALTLPLTALAAPGAPAYVRIAAEPSEAESAAAQTLCDHLEALTGTRPALTSSAVPGETQVIELALRESETPQRKGAYVLRAGFTENHRALKDKAVFHIDAFDARGLYNGVYGFLRTFYGMEVYAAGVIDAPEAENVTLPASYWYEYAPLLEYADTDWISPHDLEFSLANGLNGMYSPLEDAHGGKVNYIWFCHSLTGGIVPKDTFFDSHPEYYALTERNGKREPTQLCLSNPEVVEQAKQDVLNNLKNSYNPAAALNIVSVTQADNQDYCVCENCTALAEKYGGQSGLMIWFVNQIAEVVEKEYPDVVVDTFAYQYTRHAPKDIRPRDNVCVRLCSIECCFAHALEDPACETNAAFMQDLQNWSAISNRLYVWDYVTNFIQTLGIFPNFGVLRANVDTFRKHNVVGIYEEGNYYADGCNTEFADLRAYLLSALMQNELTAEQEAEKRAGFLKAYYGEGAEEVGEFLDYITAHAGNEEGHLHIYDSMNASLHGVTDEDAARMDALWETALREARDAGNTAAAERIGPSQTAWNYWEACVCKGKFRSLLPGIPNPIETKRLIDALQYYGVTRYNEGRTMDQIYPTPIASPNNWEMEHPLTYPIAVACAAVVLLLILITAIVALRKKHAVLAVLSLVAGALAAVFGTWASILFIKWDQLLLYACVDAVMLLSVAFFGFAAAWARNGCRFAFGKRGLITVLVVLAVAAAPYEVGVLLINTIILNSRHPTFAITLSAFIQIAVLAVNVIVLLAALRRKKQPAPAENETAPAPEADA